jgi:hypothetical protein
MCANTSAQTMNRSAAITQPRICSPVLPSASPNWIVAVTSAEFGNTKENQFIANGSRRPGRRYSMSEPAETRKYQIDSPHNHKPTKIAMTRRMAGDPGIPKKSSGKMGGGRLASPTAPAWGGQHTISVRNIGWQSYQRQ